MPTKERYINLFTDYGFKKIFGEEPNKNLLLDFLNELLKEEQGEIRDLTYLKSEQLGDTDIDRKAIFDLYCENERGEKFIVELQKSKQNFFKDRSYEKSLKYYRDMKNSLDTAFDEGREEKEREIVMNGLQQGLEISLLAALTGLSEEAIKKIAWEISEDES